MSERCLKAPATAGMGRSACTIFEQRPRKHPCANPFALLWAVLWLTGMTAVSSAELTVPVVFSDHMVLQQGMKTPVWGTADAGTLVTIRFRDQSHRVKTDEQGRWRVQLDPMTATADQTGSDLIVEGSGATLAIHDVVVGEVWLGSGQSNMVGPCKWGETFWCARKEDVAAAKYSGLRLITIGSKKKDAWTVCSPESALDWSALMFYTGRDLHRELKVPVGLIVAAVGNTAVREWIDPVDFMRNEGCRTAWDKWCQVLGPQMQKDFLAKAAEWDRLYGPSSNAKPGDKAPQRPYAPEPFDPKGPRCGGLYQRLIAQVVGYGIRGLVWDQGERGSGFTGVDWSTAMVGLLSGWRRAWGQEFPVLYVQKPSGGGFPFEKPPRIPPFPFKDPRQDPLLSQVGDGFYREQYQGLTKKLPGVAMCIAVDLEGGLHPAPKDRYGKRLAQIALGMVYGKDVQWRPPQYAGHSIVENQIRIVFDHLGKGLTTPANQPVAGFAVAGSDRRFVWAQAKIDGDTVVVSSDQVPAPAAVRYAWGGVNWANLFGKNELPVLTFRTDDWPQEKKP